MKKILLFVMLLFLIIFIGCSSSTIVNKNNTQEVQIKPENFVLEEVSDRYLASLTYVKEDSSFNYLKLKEGYKKVFSDGGCTDEACNIYAIYDGKKYYKSNKNNLQILLNPYKSENEIEEYFNIIYNSKSTQKIYFLKKGKSKYKLSYCDFTSTSTDTSNYDNYIVLGYEKKGNLRFQEITLNENYIELEVNNLNKIIKNSDECIYYYYG